MKLKLKPGISLMKTQFETLKRYCKDPRAIDNSEMGAGKTWPAALIALGAYEDGHIDHAIIVTPKAVLGDWLNVYENIIDTDFRNNVTLFYAPKKVLPFINLRPIIIATYETIMFDIERFKTLAKNKKVAVIFDEAHKLKNHESNRSKELTKLAHLAVRSHLLTGTPLTNGIKNAFAYLNMQWPGEFYSSFRHFKLRHFIYPKGNARMIVGYKNIEAVAKIFSERSIRYLKRNIMDLPPVTYITRHLDWDPAQKRYYKELMSNEIIELEDRFIEAASVGARLARFHQIITNPAQLGLKCTSTRWKALDDELESIDVENNKVIVFAHFRATIEMLAEKYKHLNPAIVYGGTADIEAEKHKFNNDPSCRMFIGNAKSAGIGINLTIASYMLFFEYTYDLDDFDQAVARIDRPGQTQKVTVVLFAIKGSMEDKKIIPALINKKTISMLTLKDPKEFMNFIGFSDEESSI